MNIFLNTPKLKCRTKHYFHLKNSVKETKQRDLSNALLVLPRTNQCAVWSTIAICPPRSLTGRIVPAMLKTLDRESIMSNISLIVVASFNCGKDDTRCNNFRFDYLGNTVSHLIGVRKKNFVPMHHLIPVKTLEVWVTISNVTNLD